ncbi:MAG: GNAT family N-acetyltransferase [Christensenellales bacterium]|jgi:ribosomal-protein-alanine N-acetyltransferase
MKPLETPRLNLRRWYESDAKDLFAYARLPQVGPSAGWKPHETLSESISIIRKFIAEDETWAVVDKVSRRVIGSVGLHRDDMRAIPNCRSLGYALSPSFWGRGFATEAALAALRFAFLEMELALVSASHYPGNLASQRVIEKCGFRHEGTVRGAARSYDGKAMDLVCYSLLREEYLAMHPEL